MNEYREADIIIVGAGPAGLSAARACVDSGQKVLVVERGRTHDLREAHDRISVVSGVGGAGLFSDGKFSYFPSATGLWLLSPRDRLQRAYSWFCSLVSELGLPTARFPSVASRLLSLHPTKPPTDVSRKEYPSHRMPFADRLGLIRKLSDYLHESLLTDHEVMSFTFRSGELILEIKESGCDVGELPAILRPKAAIIAGGRFSPISFCRYLPSHLSVFRRVELGVRLEQPSAEFILARELQLDPKFIWIRNGVSVEFRTFCCCREGEVIITESDGLVTVSGRSPTARTGRSNLGLLARFNEESSGSRIWESVLPKLNSLSQPVEIEVDL